MNDPNWWLLFSHLPREDDTQRLLRETLNMPLSPFKYVADPSLIDDNIKHIIFETNHNIYNTCPITMEDFEIGETLYQLKCGHIFKPDAIKNWLLTEKAECPVCRDKLPCIEIRISEEYHLQDQDDNHNHQEQRNNINNFLSTLQTINSLTRYHQY